MQTPRDSYSQCPQLNLWVGIGRDKRRLIEQLVEFIIHLICEGAAISKGSSLYRVIDSNRPQLTEMTHKMITNDDFTKLFRELTISDDAGRIDIVNDLFDVVTNYFGINRDNLFVTVHDNYGVEYTTRDYNQHRMAIDMFSELIINNACFEY